jgi:drug/metabolite transporter (DMT)-like permease
VAAAIWGFAFVAQKTGMEHVGPFTFNATRFAVGSLALVPLAVHRRRRRREDSGLPGPGVGRAVAGGCLAGLVLFLGASLQQIGIVYTTAGKAGFITGLYVVIVPLLGLIWRHRPPFGAWAGAAVAVVGLYLLSVRGTAVASGGDLLVFGSAVFWAVHVLAIGWLVRTLDPVELALTQFTFCSCVSALAAWCTETPTAAGLQAAAIPIAYAGLVSVGVAYTLQVLAQRDARPTHAAIILSMESVFAALGGWLVLGELLSFRATVGCALMLFGATLSILSRRGELQQSAARPVAT